MSKPQINPFEFDSRMVEWNLKHGKITKEQLSSYLSSLPDEAENAENLEIEETDIDEGGGTVNGTHANGNGVSGNGSNEI